MAASRQPVRTTARELPQHYRLAGIAEHAALRIPLDGAIQHHALELRSDGDQVLGHNGVIDACDFLLDDRAFIEVGGDVMCRRADQLDPARMRLVIGLGTFEAGQE